MNKHERFVTVWQNSSGATEAAEELGMNVHSACTKAAQLRKRGVPLKKFIPRGPGIDIDVLKKLCTADAEA